MISMDWLSSSHRGIRAWGEETHHRTQTGANSRATPGLACSKPWQLDTSLRTFSSARSRDLSSSLSLFSSVNMSHFRPKAKRWNSACEQQQSALSGYIYFTDRRPVLLNANQIFEFD